MGKKTFYLVALHGETDQAAALARAEHNHRRVHPLWRARADFDNEADYNAYLESVGPIGRPDLVVPACDVVAVFRTDDGNSHLEIHTQDWKEASELAAGDELELEF